MSATAKTSLNMTVNGVNGVIPVIVNYTNTGNAETIKAAETGKMIAVVGWLGLDSTASDNVWMSASDEYATLEMAANQGVIQPIGNPVFVTQPGEALQWKGSAVLTKACFFIQVSDKFNVGAAF